MEMIFWRKHIVILILFIPLILAAGLYADARSALFLGNSYTYVNDLPSMIASLAESGGDTLLFDVNAPGGYTLHGHSENPTSISKITSDTWNYVVLQEQSQMPTIPFYRESWTYPAARELDSLIGVSGSETVFFMTWGRRYGGIQCIDTFCSVDFVDFDHMQDTLAAAYDRISGELAAILAPVGAAWSNALDIDSAYVFWSGDNSHPNVYGSYLAACVFYSVFFGESPEGYSYHGGLSAMEASFLQQVGFETAADYLHTGDESHTPERFDLKCHPNPFNSAVRISLDFESESRSVEQVGSGPPGVGASSARPGQVGGIEIYDISGRLVADLAAASAGGYNKGVGGSPAEGPTPVIWQPGESIGSGVYLVRARIGDESISRKIVYMK